MLIRGMRCLMLLGLGLLLLQPEPGGLSSAAAQETPSEGLGYSPYYPANQPDDSDLSVNFNEENQEGDRKMPNDSRRQNARREAKNPPDYVNRPAEHRRRDDNPDDQWFDDDWWYDGSEENPPRETPRRDDPRGERPDRDHSRSEHPRRGRPPRRGNPYRDNPREDSAWFDEDWWHDDSTWFDENWWQDQQEEYDYQLGREDADEYRYYDNYYGDNDLPQHWWEMDNNGRYMPEQLQGLNQRYEGEPADRPENNIYTDWWEDHGAGYGYQYSHSNLSNQYYTADDWWD